MTDKILQIIEDSQHKEIIPIFEDALRSGKQISIEGGALPVALKADGGIYHGAFDRAARRNTGELLTEADQKITSTAFENAANISNLSSVQSYEVDTTAFEIAMLLALYAQKNGIDASLSIGLWDVEGVPKEQRKTFANRLLTNQDLEAIPPAYQEVAMAMLGSKQEMEKFFAQTNVLLQSKYEQSLGNRWRSIKKRIKKTDEIENWAKTHFDKTGQVFLAADDDGASFSFLSTLQTRQPLDASNSNHPSERVLNDGSLPIVICGQSQCGLVAGGRMNEMRKNARANSTIAKQNGVFTFNIQDSVVDAGSPLKVARSLYFQNLGANSELDKHAAYVLPADTSTAGHIIQLPEAQKTQTFDEALSIARERIATSMQIDSAGIYGTHTKSDDKKLNQKAAGLMCSNDVCNLDP